MIYTKKENIKIWSRKLEWSGMKEAEGGWNERQEKTEEDDSAVRWGSYLSYFKSYDTLSKSIEEIDMVAIKKWIIVFVENWL